MSALVKKEILSIEIHNLFTKYANISNYNAKEYQKKMNPREIDEIISKYILYHLQMFFREGPPHRSSSSKQIRRPPSNKTARKKRSSNHNPSNVFYIDKTTAVKNMHNKTIRNR